MGMFGIYCYRARICHENGQSDTKPKNDMQIASSPHAQVASNDPFLSFEDFTAFMEHAVSAVPMKQGHAYFQLNDNWWRAFCVLGFALLGQLWFGVEHRLTSFASGSGRCEVKKQGPCSPSRYRWCSRDRDVVEVIV
jgi:hypothetical protein